MFSALFRLPKINREKRGYVKLKKRGDIENEYLIQKSIIEEDESEILNVVDLNDEKIIIHRPIFGEDPFDMLIIKLTVISPKGIVVGPLKLLADYINEDLIKLGDIEVFGENRGRGYGSLLLTSLIDFAIKHNVTNITGWISKVDDGHFDQLEKFYKRNGFQVIWLETNSIKAADIYWRNEGN